MPRGGIVVAGNIRFAVAVWSESAIMTWAREAGIGGLVGIAVDGAAKVGADRGEDFEAVFVGPWLDAANPDPPDHIVGVQGPRIMADGADNSLNRIITHLAEPHAADGPKIARRVGPIARIDEVADDRKAENNRERGTQAVGHPFQEGTPIRRFRLLMHGKDSGRSRERRSGRHGVVYPG